MHVLGRLSATSNVVGVTVLSMCTAAQLSYLHCLFNA